MSTHYIMPQGRCTTSSIKLLLFHFRTIASVLQSWNSGSAKERVAGNKFEGIMSKERVYKHVLCMGIPVAL